jgi:tetratricopeptide (TPR) repeat protein
VTSRVLQVCSSSRATRHLPNKGKASNVQEVGKELGVRYVLEGSVQKDGEHVRITAQLLDATTGGHLWTERFDRPFKDIFALQDEIVQKIVTTLKLQLTLQEQGWIVRKHTDNVEAYDSYLRGIEPFFRFTQETNAQARQMWERAVALDPQYAEAYARLGFTYYREWFLRWSVDPQNLERVFALEQKAIALDDSVPIAHSILSWVYTQKQQYDQAIAEGERAIALDPNNADSYANQSLALTFAGRHEEALRAIEQAIRFNPHSPPFYLFASGIAYRFAGQYPKAIVTLKEVISRNPNDVAAHNNLAASYWLQWASQQSPAGQTLEPAVGIMQRALTLNDSWFWVHIFLGYIALYQQQYDQALAEMERAVVLAPTVAESYTALAEVLCCMGRLDDALEAAARAQHQKNEFADDHLGGIGIAYAMAGHYAEAQALLQRSLSRYPNILRIHLTLAAVYSELGQDAEARAEATEVLRLNPHFSLEVHKERVPIKDPAMLERHLAALRKAGLK